MTPRALAAASPDFDALPDEIALVLARPARQVDATDTKLTAPILRREMDD